MSSTPAASNNHLVWIDLEMTGLDPASDSIIEIATLVTDQDLNLLAEGPELAIHHSLETLEAMAPQGVSHKPVVVLLTPGIFNSAYFEHSFLAQKMGIPLVEGRDLVVDQDAVWMLTTKGRRKVGACILDGQSSSPRACSFAQRHALA